MTGIEIYIILWQKKKNIKEMHQKIRIITIINDKRPDKINKKDFEK